MPVRGRPVQETTLCTVRSHGLGSASHCPVGIWVVVAGLWPLKESWNTAVFCRVQCAPVQNVHPHFCAHYNRDYVNIVPTYNVHLYFSLRNVGKKLRIVHGNMVHFYMKSAIFKCGTLHRKCLWNFFFSPQAAGLQLLPQHP
ncbi:hypothetical protein HJG60_011370 [Phyllostomus discolor]|uniref:Uncharacterized protein n=1 Tax=Phyllostomus discolor TaxID=89673 RepID=A0A834E1R7_9CHIR|nr:hypothetical protein HJG60_011370 [Phyllostomus discolor]